MARNKSEKLPPEKLDVDPDFYKILRIYAEAHVKRDVPTRMVRDASKHWGVGGERSRDLFNAFPDQKKNRWWDLADSFKQAYVADYMEYLYGT